MQNIVSPIKASKIAPHTHPTIIAIVVFEMPLEDAEVVVFWVILYENYTAPLLLIGTISIKVMFDKSIDIVVFLVTDETDWLAFFKEVPYNKLLI